MNRRAFAATVPFGALFLAASLSMRAPAIGRVPEARSASLEVTVTGIKKATGVIRLALCPQRAKFPDCGTEAVRTESLPIEGGQARIRLTGLVPGTYAVSVFHDANSNGKLDTFVGIPREGYGFSNNPAFQPRAPRFSECEMVLAGADAATIRLRYLL
jgi:uncharacterized protein (DUF2141 family)